MASGVFHQLYFHIVWSTIQRVPLINDEVRPFLIATIGRECSKREAIVLACNAMPDHVHLLVSVPPGDLGRFVGQIKGASSHHFNVEFSPRYELKWQTGYGVLSLRESDTAKVIRYITHQEEIHAARTAGDALLEITDTNARNHRQVAAPS